MHDLEIFEPFERLVNVAVCGHTMEMPEKNTILRGLQFADMDAVSDGEFCWNGECLNCQVWLKNGEKEKAVMACRTEVMDDMEIVRTSDEIAAVLA
mgnify:CR=1 FL=1